MVIIARRIRLDLFGYQEYWNDRMTAREEGWGLYTSH